MIFIGNEEKKERRDIFYSYYTPRAVIGSFMHVSRRMNDTRWRNKRMVYEGAREEIYVHPERSRRKIMHPRVCHSHVNPDDLEVAPEREITRGDITEVTALKYILYV